MKIILYTISNCPFCKQAKDFFSSKNIQYEEKNVETNREFLSEMLSLSGDFAGVPFTVVQKDDGSKSFLKGFTQEEFEKELVTATVPVVEVAQTVNVPNIPSSQDPNIPNVNFANDNQNIPNLPPIDLPTSQPGENIQQPQPTEEKPPEPKIEEVAQTINIPTPPPVITDVPVVPTPVVEPTTPVSNVPSPEPVQIETPTENIQQPQPTEEKPPEPKIEEVAQTINIPTPPVIADVPVVPTPAVEPTAPVSNVPSSEPVKPPEEKKDDINDELKNVLSSLENMTNSEEQKKDNPTTQQGPLS